MSAVSQSLLPRLLYNDHLLSQPFPCQVLESSFWADSSDTDSTDEGIGGSRTDRHPTSKYSYLPSFMTPADYLISSDLPYNPVFVHLPPAFVHLPPAPLLPTSFFSILLFPFYLSLLTFISLSPLLFCILLSPLFLALSTLLYPTLSPLPGPP